MKSCRKVKVAAAALNFLIIMRLIFIDSLQMYIMEIRKEGVEWSNLHTGSKSRIENKML